MDTSEYASGSDDSWTCLFENELHMTCWFDVEKLFNILIDDKKSAYRVTIDYDVGGFFTQKKFELEGKCVILHDLSIVETGRCIFNISLLRPENEVLVNITIQFNSSDYTKPGRIMDLQYGSTSTSTSLKFNLSRKFSSFEKEIRIRYRPEYERNNDGLWMEKLEQWKKRGNQLFNPIFRNDWSVFSIQTLLTNLQPFTVYDVIIDVILCDDGTRQGFWSDTVNLTFKTNEDVPVDVPDFHPGYFTSYNESTIHIFWKPIAKIKRCGVIINYKVTISSFENGYIGNKTTILIHGNKTSVIIPVFSHKINQINITQRTRVGYPLLGDASIYVIPEQHRPTVPETFYVEVLNRTSIEVTWGTIDTKENVKSVHIVWCSGTKQEHCIAPIKSTALPLARNSTNITVERGSIYDYVYGIFVEGESKQKIAYSSGIFWYTDCLYRKEGVPHYGPVISAAVYSDSMILVKWKRYSCQEAIVRINHYIVAYCKTEGKNCTGEVKIQTVPREQYSFPINNLENGRTYAVKVGTKLRNGKQNGPWSKISYLTIPESTVFDNLLLIIMTVSAAVVFIAIVYLVRTRLQNAEDESLKIELPVIQKSRFTVSESDPCKHGLCIDSGLGDSYKNTEVDCNHILGGSCNAIHNSVKANRISGIKYSSLPTQFDLQKSANDRTMGVQNTEVTDGYREFAFVDSEDENEINGWSVERYPLEQFCHSRGLDIKTSDLIVENIYKKDVTDFSKTFDTNQGSNYEARKKLLGKYCINYETDSNISSYCRTDYS